MKASASHKYGPPDILKFKELEKPVPKDNEVLIKIVATTVNRTDCATLRAIPFFARIFTGIFKPKKIIFGSEFSGRIEAIGKNVSLFKTDDEVFGINEDSFGSHAEYMTKAEDSTLAIKPENISFKQAAASTEGAFYAYNFINKVNLEPGQKVLVNGAASGISSAAIQLLKHFNADVTGVCSTKNIELVKSLGVDSIIDYTKEDFTKGEQRYDYVFDSVGKSSFLKCYTILKPGGIYISSDLGYMAQNIFLPMITPLIKSIIGGKKTASPIPTDCKEILLFIKKLIEEEKFMPVIDREYPFNEIIEAYKYVEKGHKKGNVVITI